MTALLTAAAQRMPQLPMHGSAEARILLLLAVRENVTARQVGLTDNHYRFRVALLALRAMGWPVDSEPLDYENFGTRIMRESASAIFECAEFLQWQDAEVVHAMESTP